MPGPRGVYWLRYRGRPLPLTRAGSGGTPTPSPAPSFTTQPSVSPSSGLVGDTFTGSTGSISGGSAALREWLLDGSAISGANGSTYMATTAGNLSFRVTASGAGGSATATSTAATVVGVGAVAPTITTAPAFTGTAQDGQTLTGTRGTYTNSPTSYTNQWQRSMDGTTWTNISGETALTYLQVTADVGKVLRLTEIATNAGGSSASNPSSASGTVAAAVTTITTIVHDADSISNSNPGVNDASFFPTYYAQQTTGLTNFYNRAQPSRTVGGAAYAAEGADTGTPTGNTMLDHRAEAIAYNAQLLTTMIGANDLGTFATQGYINRLITYKSGLTGGVKFAWSPPMPYRQTSPQATYATFTSNRNALLATCRDPAVWGQWCDYYFPIGEHPDFLDSANDATLYGDGIHPTGPAATAATGQGKLYSLYAICTDTVRDNGQINSTQMYSSAWLASETNLPTSTEIVRRFVVKGLAHKGIALTSGNALSVTGGAQLRRGGGTYGTSLAGWLYNGDVIDVKLTTSGSNSTAVSTDLKIGSETRTLSYTTGAVVTPVAYQHGDVEGSTQTGTTHTYTKTFPASGLAVIGVNWDATVTGVSVGGVAATRRIHQVGDYGASMLDVWTVAVTAGSRAIVLTSTTPGGGTDTSSAISWGVITGADPTPTSTAADNAADTANMSTGSITVPTSGLALGFFGEYAGGSSVTAAIVNAGNTGTTSIDEGQIGFNGEVKGLLVAKRSATGAFIFDFSAGGYSPHPRAAIAFKATGT